MHFGNSKLPIGLFCLAILASTIGCGPTGDFSVATVEGTIKTADGKPIESGILRFSPVPADSKAKSGKPAMGRIKDGKFVLTTYGNEDGAVIGKHTVSLREAAGGGGTKHNCVISPEFESVTVESGGNIFDLVAIPKKKAAPNRRQNGAYEEEEDDD